MSIPITWTKTWSNSDDGTYLHGADLANIQSDIVTALTVAVGTSTNNTFSGTQTFNGAVVFTSSVSGVNPKIVVITDQASPVFDASAGDFFTLSMELWLLLQTIQLVEQRKLFLEYMPVRERVHLHYP
jgi:hypothetical protein